MTITRDAEISALKLPAGARVKRFAVQSKYGGGLKMEVRDSGLKRFVYRYKIAGKEGELLFGSYPAMTLAKARQAHGEAVALVKKGIDPRHVRREEKVSNEQMPTLEEVFAKWFEFKVTIGAINHRTAADYAGAYRRHLDKALGRVRVCDLSRAILAGHFTEVRKTGTEAVRKGLIVLNMCLDAAVLHGHIAINPARLLKPAHFNASMKKPRERWLPKAELTQFWQALNDATQGAGSVASGGSGLATSAVLSPAVANALRLIVLTGTRRGEAAGMRWDQITLDKWILPETKNGRSHVVTLCPLAMSILELQRPLSQGAWVFESSNKPGYPITGDAIMRAVDRLRKKYLPELEPFTVHDLRRSCATGCAEYLDAPERLIELMLNHVPKDRLIRTYQVGSRAEKLRALFLRWGTFIETEIASDPEPKAAGDNIVRVKFGKP